MDFSEAIASVRAGEASEEALSVIEKSHNDYKASATGHKGRADRFEPLVEKLNTLTKTLADSGLSLDSDIAEQLAALKGAPAAKDSEITRMRSDFSQKFAALEAKEKAATEKARKKSAEADLIPAFSKVFTSGSVVYKSLVADGLVKYDENEQAYVTLDGEDYRGDALAAKLKDHPEYKGMVTNTQAPGGGSNGAKGGNGLKQMTSAEFMKIGSKEKAAFMNDGGTLI